MTLALPFDKEPYLSALNVCALSDAVALHNLLDKVISRASSGKPYDRLLSQLDKRLQKSLAIVKSRQEKLPRVTYSDNLPVAAKRDEIAALIRQHQVVVLAGETGSGKTTQIPKICLELGFGVRGLIGHTQPRRIAARTVASRIAEELNVELGTAVGYQVRFNDVANEATYIKLMTDGILLAEIQHDRLLSRYDVIIIDEAHERSLNIDFLMGYLKRILPERPDLKVIITSATIDVERFSRHFNDAPVLTVEGRTYPVDVQYQPWQDVFEDQSEAIIDAISQILSQAGGPGDILVFLSGEREIRETALAIRKAEFKHLEVLPLYARLSLQDQNRAFQSHRGRRVVLATNVAETSITVPGIRYVIDPGTARVSRYSAKTKVQRLPIEPISQASANQRKGRCGRVANGTCVRLYSEEDFLQRSEFTDPEIIRTNLAAVILQMLHLRVGDIRDFPFVDAPDSRLIRDGFKLLEEIQAVTKKGHLTAIGRQLVKLPLDPRLGRMLLEADQRGSMKELLIVVSALTIQDPRERPHDKQQAADEKHRRFGHEQSDFLAYINLWEYVEEQRQHYSQNQWRKQSAKEYLSYLRLKEWRELHHQIRLALKNIDLKENKEPASYEAIHRAILAGLISHVGCRNDEANDRSYIGVRNRHFSIFPGSTLFKKKWPWIMAADFLDTSKLYAHCVAKIEPEWVIDCAKHLLKHHYYEPHYVAKTGQVMGFDRVTLLGLVLADKKRVNYSHVDKSLAREVFIRSALVEGGYARSGRRASGRFFQENRRLIDEVVELEAKSRRRDILEDDDILFQFYDERVSDEVVNLAGFEHWRKNAEKQNPRILYFSRDLIMRHSAGDITVAQFPAEWESEGMRFALKYHFEPGGKDDGVSVQIPASLLHTLSPERLEWVVPGILREKCIALIKALPKAWRKQFVPVPEYVDRFLASSPSQSQPLYVALSQFLSREAGQTFPADLWDGVTIDPYYLMNIHVLDEKQKIMGRGRDFTLLREQYREHVREGLSQVSSGLEQAGLKRWTFGELPEQTTFKRGAMTVKGFPALVDEGSDVSLKVMDNPHEAFASSKRGVLRLMMLSAQDTTKYLQKHLLRNKDIALAVVPAGKRDNVVDSLLRAVFAACCLQGNDLPRDKKAFEDAFSDGVAEVTPLAYQVEAQLLESLESVVRIKKYLKTSKNALSLVTCFADVTQQLDQLFYPDFMGNMPLEWFQQYPRYLRAIEVRLEKAPQDPRKDQSNTQVLANLFEQHTLRLRNEGQLAYQANSEWQKYRWMLEELRVSLFAQTLKTRIPVSEKRLQKQWQESLKPLH